MAGPGNRHCANCIGALSFPMNTKRAETADVARVLMIEETVQCAHSCSVP